MNEYTSGRYGLAEVPENMFSAFYGLYTSVWGHSGGENNWDAPQEGFETKHSYTWEIVVPFFLIYIFNFKLKKNRNELLKPFKRVWQKTPVALRPSLKISTDPSDRPQKVLESWKKWMQMKPSKELLGNDHFRFDTVDLNRARVKFDHFYFN